MKTCEECLHSQDLDKYNSGSCFRFPPIPVYQRIEWQYGEPVMGIQAEYPIIYRSNRACGEFQSKNEPGILRGAALYQGEEVTGL